jgi:hypothetical protein
MESDDIQDELVGLSVCGLVCACAWLFSQWLFVLEGSVLITRFKPLFDFCVVD